MKNLIALVLISLLSLNLFSQTKEKELSKSDLFSAKSGTLIEKKFIDVGKLRKLDIKVLKLKDLADNSSISSLRFELEVYKSYGTSTKLATLDKDEIDGLLKSIKLLQTNVFTTKADVYTEITFRSRSGFEAGCYFNIEKSIWATYLQLDKYDKDSIYFLSEADFEEIYKLIELAKTKM